MYLWGNAILISNCNNNNDYALYNATAHNDNNVTASTLLVFLNWRVEAAKRYVGLHRCYSDRAINALASALAT